MLRLGLRGLPGLPFAGGARNQTAPSLTPSADPRPEIDRGVITAFRRFRPVDAYDLIQWGKHEDVLLENYNLPVNSPEDARAWYHLRQSYVDTQLYAVDSLAERRVVGYIGLREIDLTLRMSVLGINFDPRVLDRGYGTDSLKCFLRHYFERWQYDSMHLDVAAFNMRGRRCYEKCGYRYTGERWKPFGGVVKQALKSPTVRDNPELFLRRGSQLYILFHDMVITRTDWRLRGLAEIASD